MFFEGEAAVGQVAEKAVHGEMEVGVVVIDGGEESVDCDEGVQLLSQFADEGLFAAFAGLHLAAGEFPPPFPFAVAALGGEDFIVSEDDGGNYFDLPVCLLRGTVFTAEKHFRCAVHEGYWFKGFHVG